MPDCLFCKIINKEIAANIVYEDDKVIAFLDINPVNAGHTLVVPKDHHEQLPELPDELSVPVISIVKKVMQALMSQSDIDGVNIIQNNYAAAGQVVPHIHFHVIPRREGDGHRHWPGIEYKEGEAEEVAERLRDAVV